MKLGLAVLLLAVSYTCALSQTLILPLHWAIPAAPGNLLIRHAKGSDANAEDFTPMMESVEPGKDQHYEPEYGRSSSGMTLPFFNLQ
jgi:hypothetical protein